MNIMELVKDALPIIERSAPIIASSLGSPFAGVAISLLSSALGFDQKNPQELVQKLTQHDCHDELHKLEQSHGDWLKSLMEAKKSPKNFKVNINIQLPDN